MKVGDCFKVESSYGDDRSSYWVFRRIRFVGVQIAECYRFEVRPSNVSAVGEFVLRPSDPIGLDVLAKQTSIPLQEWQMAYERFFNLVNEPWNVE